MRIPTIKDVMRGEAEFVRYQDGKLWYQIVWYDGDAEPWPVSRVFDFPVPVEDAGGGSFGPAEKALTLMRWIRKHIEFMQAALDEAKSSK